MLWPRITAPLTPPRPRHVQAALIGALVYFVAPIDLIPDVVVGLGYADDAAVLAAGIAAVRKYLTPGHYARARKMAGWNLRG